MSNANKRKREDEDHEDTEADRVAKKSKCDLIEINTLPEELIMQILVRVPKKNLEALSETSTQWLKITRSRDFWRLSCQYRWTSVVASDNLEFTSEEYVFPTVMLNGRTLVDWQFYYKIRKKLGKAIKSVAEQSQRFPDILAAAVGRILSKGTELLSGTVASVFEIFPILSLAKSLFPVLVVPILDLAFDMALLRYNRGEIAWFRPNIMLLEHVIDCSRPTAKIFSFCRRAYGLLQLVRDNNEEEIILTLVKVITQLFRSRTTYDERSKKLFGMVTECMIGLGPLDLGKDKYLAGSLAFQRPFGPASMSLLKQFARIKESFTTMVVDIASRMYHASNDWKIKASAIAVAWNSLNKTTEYTEKYCALAVHAARQPESELSFVGLIGLYNIVRKSDECETQFNGELATTIFDVFTDALMKYDANIGLKLYMVLWQILPAVQSDLVSDELLNQFIANVLDLFARLDQNVAQVEDKFVFSFGDVGTKFKGRLAKIVEKVKTTFFSMNKERFPSERLLECYVDFGMAVQGEEFASEFRQLAKQIIAGTLPFKVSVVACYGRMADDWLHFAESEEEREHIIRQLIEAIPQVVSDFGQSGVFEEQQRPETGPESLPNTFQEILDEYEGDGLDKIDVTMEFHAPEFYVSKEHLTPVNPSGIIRDDRGAGITREIAESHLYASRLLIIVIKNEGKYVQHAQKVLHAMLAPYRILFNTGELHHAILALLALVKPEMDPIEFLKYIEIILHTMANQIDPELSFSQITQRGISDLFAFCFGLLEPCGVSKASTIRNAINAYLLMYDFSVPKFMELDKLIYYCITTWPRIAYEGIRQSILAIWLVKRVKNAESLEQKMPLLFVFATAAVFYSVGFVSEHLCADDPDEEDYESSDKYLARIMPDCRALYMAALEGKEGFEMNARQLKILRNFLILHALDVVHGFSTEVSMLRQVDDYQEYLLTSATTYEIPFDTGVPELTSLFKELDLSGICKLLSLKCVVYSDEEEERGDYEDNEAGENNKAEDNNQQ